MGGCCNSNERPLESNVDTDTYAKRKKRNNRGDGNSLVAISVIIIIIHKTFLVYLMCILSTR